MPSQLSTSLSAGAAETAITPDAVGTFLIGPMKPSTGVNDDLFARVLVLSDGRRQAAIVTLDWLGFDFAFNEILVAAISQATGIPAAHILICCSHTHNAPLTIPWGPWEQAKDKPFHEYLPRRLAEVVRQAQAKLAPARLRHCRGPAQVGINRRYPVEGKITMAPNPLGKIVPWVDVLSAEDAGGQAIAVLFSHAAHPVIVHGSSTLISADYPGFTVQKLREMHGPAGVYMFAQGCGANINGFPLRGGLDAARAAGRDLAQAVTWARAETDRSVRPTTDKSGCAVTDKSVRPTGDGCIEAGDLRTASLVLDLPLQPPPPAGQTRAKLTAETDPLRRTHLERLLAMAEGRKPATVRFPISGLALGRELCILAFAHECVSEYQLFADRVSPFPHHLTFAYTNGVECYIATAKDYRMGEAGGYEAAPSGSAVKYVIASPPVPQAERLIRQGIRQVLAELHSGG